MNFAMTRAFPTKEHHLFYDSGALSTSATLVSFHTFPAVPSSPLIGKSSKYTPAKVNTTHVEVLGLGFDDALGGQRLDALIKRMLVNEFEAKLGKPMEEGGDETFKALGKMGKEAARVKAILSANADAAVGVRTPNGPARLCPVSSGCFADSVSFSLPLRTPDRVALQRHRLPDAHQPRAARRGSGAAHHRRPLRPTYRRRPLDGQPDSGTFSLPPSRCAMPVRV